MNQLTCPACGGTADFSVIEEVTTYRRLRLDGPVPKVGDISYDDGNDHQLQHIPCGHRFDVPQWLADIDWEWN